MTEFRPNDMVRNIMQPSHIPPMRVDRVEPYRVWCICGGAPAAYPPEDLRLDPPDPSRKKKPTSVRRIPYGSRR